MPSSLFVDAQERHAASPETFAVPTAEVLAAIGPGWSVKVCTGGERFWLRVSRVLAGKIQGAVANDLVATEVHGLQRGDEVTVELRHVFAASPPEGAACVGQWFSASCEDCLSKCQYREMPALVPCPNEAVGHLSATVPIPWFDRTIGEFTSRPFPVEFDFCLECLARFRRAYPEMVQLSWREDHVALS